MCLQNFHDDNNTGMKRVLRGRDDAGDDGLVGVR